jgi:hypothetical protein
MESDLELMRLLCNVMGQGGNKHASLLLPSLHYCLGVWQRAGAGASSRDADAGHIKVRGVGVFLLLSLSLDFIGFCRDGGSMAAHLDRYGVRFKVLLWREQISR